MHLAEIHGCSLYRYDGSVGHISSIDGCKVISIDVQMVVFGIACRLSVEVPIRMVSHVNDSFLIGCSRVLNINSVIISKGIGYNSLYITREVVVIMGRKQREPERIRCRLFAIENLILPACEAAVKAMAIVVLR